MTSWALANTGGSAGRTQEVRTAIAIRSPTDRAVAQWISSSSPVAGTPRVSPLAFLGKALWQGRLRSTGRRRGSWPKADMKSCIGRNGNIDHSSREARQCAVGVQGAGSTERVRGSAESRQKRTTFEGMRQERTRHWALVPGHFATRPLCFPGTATCVPRP